MTKFCLCGEILERKVSPNKTPYWSKYCSSDCKKSFGSYRKGEFKSALCLSCGEEFTKPASYASAMKYCSNKCSHSERKRVRDRYVMTLHEDAIIFRSTWELRFVATCLRFGIPWRRYDGDYIETSVGNYRPDFIVGVKEYIVEVKGFLNMESIIKIEAGKQEFGDRYKVILEEDLIQFEETGELFGEPVDVKSPANRTSG